jgi:hypothetical protein
MASGSLEDATEGVQMPARNQTQHGALREICGSELVCLGVWVFGRVEFFWPSIDARASWSRGPSQRLKGLWRWMHHVKNCIVSPIMVSLQLSYKDVEATLMCFRDSTCSAARLTGLVLVPKPRWIEAE